MADTREKKWWLQLFAPRCFHLWRVRVLSGQRALYWQACFVFPTIASHERAHHNTALHSSYLFYPLFHLPFHCVSVYLIQQPSLNQNPRATKTCCDSIQILLIPLGNPGVITPLNRPSSCTRRWHATHRTLPLAEKQRAGLVWITLNANLTSVRKGGPVRECR